MKAGIVGANGYSGVELIRLLLNHPQIKIEMLVAHSTTGMEISSIYPHLGGIVERRLEAFDADELAARTDVVFFATPAGVSKDLLPECLKRGLICIDLSGDFRLKNPQDYAEWYKKNPADAALLGDAVYGLSELNREQIEGASLLSNPGCYPTATLLGLAPVLQHDMIDLNSIIVDGKSGVSGSGKKAVIGNLFGEVNESVKAYKLDHHQHTPEIEQMIEEISGQKTAITFHPHLIPMTRGLLCTTYANLKQGFSTRELLEHYEKFYKKSPFVRIRPLGNWPATKEVLGSNFCDIGLNVDGRTRRLTIVSVIDNVVKGAAGQAVQNLNIIKGWDEQTGLTFTPIYP
ncbi:N-acetyl-gamma-glutamyl-phosphate reductase [Sporolactobacillus inulinus]|uniref:N-acetyl-gamma-glutamyl-phosphate reductase n=1 Tax=Sporolactobacillus inulinus CASD TaxID=1069536 RepID=A0A0U1QQR6_9BACL|nr:N-acetyl-gamma-glutamyl-phosphate reductase [Sporolactobacillus inulinus]KLI03147.1 N-acetyl-gamma-glutamyl-phosphate reductase [Sporolactobacillus inulinus CASD]GEB76628.1 N-acetyl-gamma-glutamyl-phosphate reductase [Sporolactobacillus inulinus]